MTEQSLEDIVHTPKRVLIIDGDIKVMETIKNKFLETQPGMQIDILLEKEIQKIPDKSYDLILMEDDPILSENKTKKILKKIKKNSPYAEFALLSQEPDREKLADKAVSAIKKGALNFIYKPNTQDTNNMAEEIVSKILIAYDARNSPDENLDKDTPPDYEFNGTDTIAEIEKLMKDTPERNNLILKIESDLDNSLSLLQDQPDSDLEKLAKSDNSDVAFAALCKLAINSFYEHGMIRQTFNYLDLASDKAPHKDRATPNALRAQIMTDVGYNFGMGSLHHFEESLKGPSALTTDVLQSVEQNITPLALKTVVRPTRGNVSTVQVGEEMECYRREDSDQKSVMNESSIYKFYRRIRKQLQNNKNIMRVPQILGVIQTADQESWAMYREYIAGTSAIDELRRIEGRIQRLTEKNKNEEDTTKKINNARTLQTSLIFKLVEQCALVNANGPVGLAEKIDDHVEDYYEDRVIERIIAGFNKLFKKSNDMPITVTEASHLVETARPIHEFLSSLETAFYKDSWYANSLIQKQGRSMNLHVHDFASVKQLPIAIDLATLLGYGNFVSAKIKLRSPTENALIEHFIKAYSSAVDEFNQTVTRFEKDKKQFILEEIARDVGYYPTENIDDIRKLEQYARSTSFKNTKHAFRKLIKKSKTNNKSVTVSEDYLKDLEIFIKNLKPKKPINLPDPKENPEEYAEILDDFTTQYYGALYHRALLMSGTCCEFIISRTDPNTPEKNNRDKQYLLLSEMIGTARNSLRAAHRISDYLKSQGELTQKDKENLIKTSEDILKRIRRIYNGKKL